MSYSCYATIIRRWATELGYDPYLYGTHSMRRTKATLIYARTKKYPRSSIIARPREVG